MRECQAAVLHSCEPYIADLENLLKEMLRDGNQVAAGRIKKEIEVVKRQVKLLRPTANPFHIGAVAFNGRLCKFFSERVTWHKAQQEAAKWRSSPITSRKGVPDGCHISGSSLHVRRQRQVRASLAHPARILHSQRALTAPFCCYHRS